MAKKNFLYPQVLKNTEMKSLVVIYWDHAEYYGGLHKGYNYVATNDGEDSKFDPFAEVKICISNGFRFVHPARDNADEIVALRDERIEKLEAQIERMKVQSV